MDDLLGGMEHYYDPNDYNRVIYHSKSEDASDRIKQILIAFLQAFHLLVQS
jgi:hypothetical protein